MLNELPYEIQREIRRLNMAMSNQESFYDERKRDLFIDILKYSISDKVLTILMEEDKKKFERFLSSK